MKLVTSPRRFVARSSHKRGKSRWLPFFLTLITAILVECGCGIGLHVHPEIRNRRVRTTDNS